jgi:hypothetical protein
MRIRDSGITRPSNGPVLRSQDVPVMDKFSRRWLLAFLGLNVALLVGFWFAGYLAQQRCRGVPRGVDAGYMCMHHGPASQWPFAVLILGLLANLILLVAGAAALLVRKFVLRSNKLKSSISG